AALHHGVELARALKSASDAVERACREAEQALRDLDAANAALAGGDDEVKALEGKLAELRATLAANGYDDELLARLSAAEQLALAMQEAQRRREAAEAELTRLKDDAGQAEGAVKVAQKSAATATKALVTAEAALQEAERHDLAATLQSKLKAGDPCPV